MWIAYGLFLLTVIKVLVADPAGSTPGSLTVTLVLLGSTLILVPRLLPWRESPVDG